MFRLKKYNVCPPGSFWYEQTEGVQRRFDSTPEIACLSKQVLNFRKGNGLPRATDGECLEDIDAFMCAQLKNNPRWVYDTEKTIEQLHPVEVRGRGCSSCGVKV